MISATLVKFSLAAVSLFLPRLTGVSRGSDGTPLPKPMPVENFGPYGTDQPVAVSPRRGAPPASHLRLVTDSEMTRASPVSDASGELENIYEIRSARGVVFDRRKIASTAKFVTWLSEFYGSEDLSKTRLLGHYFEFCESCERRPLTERKLLNSIKKYGVRTKRPTAVIVAGKQSRPTLYRVKTQQRRAA